MNNKKRIEEILNALDIEPLQEGAYQELATLYRQEEDWAALASVYERQVDLSAALEERIEALQRLALVYEEKLSDEARAQEQWSRILDMNPDHEPAKSKWKEK